MFEIRQERLSNVAPISIEKNFVHDFFQRSGFNDDMLLIISFTGCQFFLCFILYYLDY